jgi:TonB family protein
MPFYPPAARGCGIEGYVELQYTVDRDGNITEVKQQDGWPVDPILLKAAMENVNTWKFYWGTPKPPASGGAAVEFIYKLSDDKPATIPITTVKMQGHYRVRVEANKTSEHPRPCGEKELGFFRQSRDK